MSYHTAHVEDGDHENKDDDNGRREPIVNALGTRFWRRRYARNAQSSRAHSKHNGYCYTLDSDPTTNLYHHELFAGWERLLRRRERNVVEHPRSEWPLRRVQAECEPTDFGRVLALGTRAVPGSDADFAELVKLLHGIVCVWHRPTQRPLYVYASFLDDLSSMSRGVDPLGPYHQPLYERVFGAPAAFAACWTPQRLLDTCVGPTTQRRLRLQLAPQHVSQAARAPSCRAHVRKQRLRVARLAALLETWSQATRLLPTRLVRLVIDLVSREYF